MQDNEALSLWEMLEKLPTSQLDKMLHLELQKEPPDPDAVRVILHILEQRSGVEKTEPTNQQLAAREKYRQRIAESSLRQKPAPRRMWLRWSMVAASLAVVFFLMIPVRADAEGFLGVISNWKQDFLEYLVPGKARKVSVQEYTTDHPGLQQLHDEAVAFGVENPAMPQRLPEEYDASLSQKLETPSVKRIIKVFSDQERDAVFEIKRYNAETYRQFFKDDTNDKIFEKNGVTINIVRNNEKWTAIWYKDNVEYSFTMDCQEKTLYEILESIYVMEES